MNIDEFKKGVMKEFKEMKVEAAHQIANPEILIYLKALSSEKKLKCIYKAEEKIRLHTIISYQAILKGILIAQEKEVEFLIDRNKEFTKFYPINNWELSDFGIRLEALKISCEDLRKVLK